MTPTAAEIARAVQALELLDDLNESRQSDGVGAARFCGAKLLDALDRYGWAWAMVRDALAAAEADRAKWRECAQALGVAAGRTLEAFPIACGIDFRQESAIRELDLARARFDAMTKEAGDEAASD